MEIVEKYARAILSVLAQYEGRLDDQTFLITDTIHHQYQLAHAGWQNGKYINYATLHFHIKPNGRIWIYENRTEDDVAVALVKHGVAPSDIVLGFLQNLIINQIPHDDTTVRHCTGFLARICPALL